MKNLFLNDITKNCFYYVCYRVRESTVQNRMQEGIFSFNSPAKSRICGNVILLKEKKFDKR